jgi:hypothetical protein
MVETKIHNNSRMKREPLYLEFKYMTSEGLGKSEGSSVPVGFFS